MTYTRQGRDYTIDATPKQKTSDENQRHNDSSTTKKFMTNSDKSVFNLKWQVGGSAQKSYVRSRNHSQHDKIGEESNLHKSSHKHHHHRHRQSIDEKMTTSAPLMENTSHEVPQQHLTYSYPFAYPPMPVSEQPTETPQHVYGSQNHNRTIKSKTTSVVKQSDKSINLLGRTNQVKIEHHYVDSPDEAQQLIDDLRRRGFVQTGIHTRGEPPSTKK